jgi:hypothetical protein
MTIRIVLPLRWDGDWTTAILCPARYTSRCTSVTYIANVNRVRCVEPEEEVE